MSLIDVGADTIKVAVVSAVSEQVQVVGHGIASSHGHDLVGGRREAAALTAAVNEALIQAEDGTVSVMGHKVVPDDAIFVVPNRATATEVVTVRQSRADPRLPISPDEVAALWRRAGRLARQRLSAQSTTGGQMQPLATTRAGLWVDDHVVSDAVNLQGRELICSVFAVAVQAATLRALERMATRLELSIFNLVAAPQTLAMVIPRRDAVVIDVGAKGTDGYILRHDTLVAAGRAPFGGDFFTQACSRAFEVDWSAAEALKVAYGTASLSEDDTILVERGLGQAQERWRQAMADILGRLADEQPLPGYFYFVGGGSFLPGLQRGLLTWLSGNTDLAFERAPEIESLGDAYLPQLQGMPDGPRGVLFALVVSLAATLRG
jgi:cell division ATPase FtsA